MKMQKLEHVFRQSVMKDIINFYTRLSTWKVTETVKWKREAQTLAPVSFNTSGASLRDPKLFRHLPGISDEHIPTAVSQ